MRIDVISLFPEVIETIKHSIIKRSIERGLVSIETHRLRDYSLLKGKKVDGKAYGGVDGMVIRVEPVDRAIKQIVATNSEVDKREMAVVFPVSNGYQLTQRKLEKLSCYKQLIFVNGRYAGIDSRLPLHTEQCLGLETFELSVGPYIVTDGDIPSLLMIEGIIRLIEGVVGNKESVENDSYSKNMCGGFLEYPIYTAPSEWHGHSVPEVLRSGNFKEIELWKHKKSLIRTIRYQPELFYRDL
jgi:tRNA (guanine37-N1)-methyltransferase